MFVVPFEIKPASFKIDIRDQILLIGSCFAENIGRILTEYKFEVLTNPTGVIYNPISLFRLLEMSLELKVDENRIINNEEIYYHWDAHSSISANSKEGLIGTFQSQLKLTQSYMYSARVLVISLGSSWVYYHKTDDEIVANCHKVPQKEFKRSILSVDEIKNAYFKFIQAIRSINPDLHIILTVSPVRHVRDGLIQNNLSKSILIQAIHEIVDKDDKASYFPSYELVIDVLRDYRFYNEDMVHPSDQAIRFVWNKFLTTYFSKKTQEFLSEWDKVLKAINHKPFHPESPAHQKFLRALIVKLKSYEDIVDIDKELKEIENQLIVS